MPDLMSVLVSLSGLAAGLSDCRGVCSVVQVVMHGLNSAEFELTRPALTVVNDAPVELKSLNETAETLVRHGPPDETGTPAQCRQTRVALA